MTHCAASVNIVAVLVELRRNSGLSCVIDVEVGSSPTSLTRGIPLFTWKKKIMGRHFFRKTKTKEVEEIRSKIKFAWFHVSDFSTIWVLTRAIFTAGLAGRVEMGLCVELGVPFKFNKKNSFGKSYFRPIVLSIPNKRRNEKKWGTIFFVRCHATTAISTTTWKTTTAVKRQYHQQNKNNKRHNSLNNQQRMGQKLNEADLLLWICHKTSEFSC